MKRIRGRLTSAHVISLIALFVALGGSAYAATQLPKNSVGVKQLKRGAVTPAKLSRAARFTMTGATGAKGDPGSAGPQGRPGERGASGADGLPGLPGTTGGEPFVADAKGGVADLKISSPVDVPLGGTTSWTSTAGEAGLLFGKLDATLATEPSSGFLACEVMIQVFVDGRYLGFFGAQNTQQSFADSTATLAPIPVAVHEQGIHAISAKAFGRPECQPGSKLDSLQLVVAGFGA
jgi:hypothetical protein